MQEYLDILKRYWGFDSFRSMQGEIIASIGAGQDTLGLMPTGGGKSLTFQVPTMAKEGLCIVISPLIALMKDQVDNLLEKGIKAAAVYSGMDKYEMERNFDNCIFGDYKFLYVSPERLQTRMFYDKLRLMKICLIAVDEAHCISQWGYDFRPPYLKIAEIRKMLPGVPVLALTATATPEVAKDIQEKLQFDKPNTISKSFARKNLAYVVRKCEDKIDSIIKILNGVPGSTIIYVRNRKSTVEIAQLLSKQGINACHFHAGLEKEQKERSQQLWKEGTVRVMVATNAFGMGIDKPDVRSVIHIDLPDSPEAYFQEAGRAGRDGKKSFAVLLYDQYDIAKLKKRLHDNFPSKDTILRVYSCVGDFFGIAEYAAEGMGFNFDIARFCEAYKISLTETNSALRILDLAGYIEYTEDDDRPAMVMITILRNSMYDLRLDKASDAVLNTILRMYTGVFSQLTMIDETKTAQKAGVSTIQLREILISLSKRRILKYVPPSHGARIFFTMYREPLQYVSIPKSVYENRLEHYEMRIKAMEEYAKNETICRSSMLLSYFGQTPECNCGICDVCLKNKATKPDLEKEILQAIKPAGTTIKELATMCHCDEKKLFAIIRHNIDEGRLVLDGEVVRISG